MLAFQDATTSFFFEGRQAPPQLHNVLAHGVFNELLFLNTQNQPLRRGALKFLNIKIDVTGARLVVLKNAVDLGKRNDSRFSFAKAKRHYRDSGD